MTCRWPLVPTDVLLASLRARPSKATLVAAVCALVTSVAVVHAGAEPDAIDEALSLAGLTRADLGWEARGWWERYPQDIPFTLRHTDALFAEPLAIAPFTTVLGATLMQVLAPENVFPGEDGKTKADPNAGALFRAVHDLAVNKRHGASRAYSANLAGERTPLPDALLATWSAVDRPAAFRTFGTRSPDPPLAKSLEDSCASLPDSASAILGKLVLDLLDARRYAVLAFRRVPREDRDLLASRLVLSNEQADGQEYVPELDDAARAWDEASLWYAGLKVVEALDTARLALDREARLRRLSGLAQLRIDLDTPVGRVIIDGSGASTIDVREGAFLTVDFGGDDAYAGAIAGASPALPVAAALDLHGHDRYEGHERALGAGVFGAGVLLDADGDDRYTAHHTGQGAGHFGFGALLDLRGADRYDQHLSGQGFGFFGVGVLIDLEGADTYKTWGDAQGYGCVGGVGILADRGGNDEYFADPDPAVTKRPSGHSENKISASGAQGCGFGRRGDGSDGHAWSGGLGALLDGEGNDRYTVGNWGQGCGYWFGTGLLWDGGGNDEYRATGWAQASGAHFCIGALIDESGDDLHSVTQNWGPAYGHDFTASLFYDGAGNDEYVCGGEGVGHSINRSVALCFDAGGDDRYTFSTEGRHPGRVTYDPRFLNRRATSVYWTESTSVGLFIDCGGSDVYPPGFENDWAKTEDPSSDTTRARNFGIFVDRTDGRVDLDRPHGSKRAR